MLGLVGCQLVEIFCGIDFFLSYLFWSLTQVAIPSCFRACALCTCFVFTCIFIQCYMPCFYLNCYLDQANSSMAPHFVSREDFKSVEAFLALLALLVEHDPSSWVFQSFVLWFNHLLTTLLAQGSLAFLDSVPANLPGILSAILPRLISTDIKAGTEA